MKYLMSVCEKYPNLVAADVRRRISRWNCANLRLLTPAATILQTRSKPATRKANGFTLIEIMVVVIVIGILAAIIVPQFGNTAVEAKVNVAKSTVAELESAVERFYIHMDRYPTPEEGLKALVEAPSGEENKWRGPYIKLLRTDPWKNPYQYRSPGIHHPTSFDIWSRGADGADGGEGTAADIGNWQAN